MQILLFPLDKEEVGSATLSSPITNPAHSEMVGMIMTEKRFDADGIVGIIIWGVEEDGRRTPCIRLYDPRDPVMGGARKNPDGSHADFKDYRMCSMTDPSIRISDEHGAFEFIEKEDGTCLFDFSLRALGKTPRVSPDADDQSYLD